MSSTHLGLSNVMASTIFWRDLVLDGFAIILASKLSSLTKKV
jgi:hypothetical protein